MQLTDDVLHRVMQAERQYVRLKQIFASFLDNANYLVSPQSAIKSIRLEVSPEGDFLDVFFAGIQVRFLFLICSGEDGSHRGNIVCSREAPNFSQCKDIVGSFTFSSAGITDFEVADGHDKIEMGYHANEIILHFVDKTIGTPLARPAA